MNKSLCLVALGLACLLAVAAAEVRSLYHRAGSMYSSVSGRSIPPSVRC
jgi:hypothetical protein